MSEKPRTMRVRNRLRESVGVWEEGDGPNAVDAPDRLLDYYAALLKVYEKALANLEDASERIEAFRDPALVEGLAAGKVDPATGLMIDPDDTFWDRFWLGDDGSE